MQEPSHQVATNLASFSKRNEQTDLAWQSFRIERICSILRDLPALEMVADIGCAGGMAAAQYKQAGISLLHGYDVSKSSLESLTAKGFEGFYWNADGFACPAQDNTYDVVIPGEIIEHLVDTNKFAQELYRILKPGGHLILSTPNLASWYNRIRLLRGLVPRSYPGTSGTVRKDVLIDNNHIRVNTLSEWRHFLEAHRFCVKRVFGTSHIQALKGGVRTEFVKFIDRLACSRPSLSVNIIILASK